MDPLGWYCTIWFKRSTKHNQTTWCSKITSPNKGTRQTTSSSSCNPQLPIFHSMFIFARHFHKTCFVVEPETKTAVEAVITIQFLLMFWGKSLHFTSYHWNWCHFSTIKTRSFYGLDIQNLRHHHHLQDHPRTCKWSITMGIVLVP